MKKKERIIQAIFRAVEEINGQLPKEQQLAKSVDTVLIGQSGTIDSLGLVNMIVATEQKIEEEFGTGLTLADDKAMSQINSTFRTIGALADYISSVLEDPVQQNDKSCA